MHTVYIMCRTWYTVIRIKQEQEEYAFTLDLDTWIVPGQVLTNNDSVDFDVATNGNSNDKNKVVLLSKF